MYLDLAISKVNLWFDHLQRQTQRTISAVKPLLLSLTVCKPAGNRTLPSPGCDPVHDLESTSHFPHPPPFPFCQRKFRSQTSDNMDRWKAEGGRAREEKRREEKRDNQRTERVRRKKMQAHEKVEKSQFTMCFPCFAAPEGRTVGPIACHCGAKRISKSKASKTDSLGPL